MFQSSDSLICVPRKTYCLRVPLYNNIYYPIKNNFDDSPAAVFLLLHHHTS